MSEHAKTPWNAGERKGPATHWAAVLSADGRLIADVYGDTTEQAIANAAHIVHCVNANEAMDEALREARPNNIEWTRRTDDDVFEHGDVLLVAVYVRGRWVFDVVVIDCHEHYFAIRTQDGDSWEGDITDVAFYTKASRIRLPVEPGQVIDG